MAEGFAQVAHDLWGDGAVVSTCMQRNEKPKLRMA
jgi:hypothetical protein